MKDITINDYDARRLEEAAEKTKVSIATIIEWLVEENLDEIIESESEP